MMFISLFTITFSHSSSQEIEPDYLELNQEEPDFELVRGYFNEIEYTGSSEETSIELNHPDGISYQWIFSEGEWSGDLDHLHEEDTFFLGGQNRWVVSIAINGSDPADENWNIILDGDEFSVRVVESDESFSVSGSISFSFEPNMGEVQGISDSLTIGNQGNVLMSYELIYDDENLEYSSDKEILSPGETTNIVIYYNYTTSGAEIFTVELSIQRKVVGILDLQADDSHQVKSREAISRNFQVLVGYEGFEHGGDDSYSVQYERSKNVKGNTYSTVTFYIYPKEEIFIDLNGENVTFDDENVSMVARDSDGNQMEELTFDPSNPITSDHGEVEVIVEFKSHHREDGFIELIVNEDRYKTTIQISQAAPEPGDEEVSFLEEEAETITLGILLIGGVVIFGIARVLLSKKKEEK